MRFVKKMVSVFLTTFILEKVARLLLRKVDQSYHSHIGGKSRGVARRLHGLYYTLMYHLYHRN